MASKTAHSYDSKPRTDDVDTHQSISFTDMHLSPPILAGLHKAGFCKPSPIQLEAVPVAKCGKDLVIQSKSGTGKTLVFGIVSLESIEIAVGTIQVLILAPTREIAFQNAHVIYTIGSELSGLNVQVFIGGLPVETDQGKCKSCHIAVGTPGRIRQMIDNGFLKTKTIRLFILDEADKLMEESFLDDITWIFSQLPLSKQVMAVSATYPEALASLVSRYMNNPSFIRLGQLEPALLGVKQFVSRVAFHPMKQQQAKNKLDVLLQLLKTIEFSQCMVFTNLQTRAESLAAQLSSHGHAALSISGGQTQTKRLQTLLKLRQFQCKILVATDLAARGIDAEHIDLVIHMDVPHDAATYLHRVGRAGRFGSVGLAVCITCEGNDLTELRTIVTRTKASVRILDMEQLSPKIHKQSQAEGTEEPKESKEKGRTVSIQFLDSMWLDLPELEGTGLQGEGAVDNLLADIEHSTDAKDTVRALLPQGKKKKNTKGKERIADHRSVEDSLSRLNVNPRTDYSSNMLTSHSHEPAPYCPRTSSAQEWQEWYDSWRTDISRNRSFIEQQAYLDAMRENIAS